MRFINVYTKDGIRREPVYEINELAYLGKLYSSKDRKKNGINYIEIPCAFDIETTNIEEDDWTYRDTEVYEYLKKIKIRYTDDIKKEIADFEYIRKAYFNQIHLYKSKGSYIDIVYQELNQYRPDLFPSTIINQSDQLIKILDVYDQNRPLRKDEIRPYAFMYHWQFCFDDQVVFGRSWKEFRVLLHSLEVNLNLSSKNRLVIYVHNLGFEFQFMRRFIDVAEGFFMERYKPLKVVTTGGIEFRCSALLSNMKLEKFCENEHDIIHPKLSGEEFDYGILRTPSYKMSEKEEAYCYNDVRGLSECIASRLREYDIAHIPLTSTGYVRLDARNAMRKNRKNRETFHNMALDPLLYQMCRAAFRGGDTHANRRKANKLLHDIESADITSSYPASMMIDKYPMTMFRWISLDIFYKLDFNEDAVLMEISLTNVRYKGNSQIPYIPISKCVVVRPDEETGEPIIVSAISDEHHRIEDNGRILKCDMLSMTITDIDYQIIMNEYDFDTISYNPDHIFAAKKGYLPEELRNTIMKYYEAKTKLKGDKEHDYEYNKAKNMLNAIYGMMVMRIDQSVIKYENGAYVEDVPKLQETLDNYYKSRNNFLSYQWGVWVTANSRKRLREMLNVIGKDVCYCDTDSIKSKGKHQKDFDAINQKLKKQALEAGAVAKNSKGETYYLGTWDTNDGYYRKFKTLGAKKYLVEELNKDTGEYEVHSTIAGVDKKVGAKYFSEKGFDHFTDGEKIPKSGHIKAYYNDNEIHEIVIDGEHIETASNLALVNDYYTIGLTDNYVYALKTAFNLVDDIEYI